MCMALYQNCANAVPLRRTKWPPELKIEKNPEPLAPIQSKKNANKKRLLDAPHLLNSKGQ